jgi:hypothetical protein
MATLQKCVCGQTVSDSAYNCPHCGHKFRSTPINIWAKIMLFILALALIIPLGFCGLLTMIWSSNADRYDREHSNQESNKTLDSRNSNNKVNR